MKVSVRSSDLAKQKKDRAPRERRPVDRETQRRNEVLGEFSRLGLVDFGDDVTSARGERRCP